MEFNEWRKQNADKSLNDFYAWRRKSGSEADTKSGSKADTRGYEVSNSYNSSSSVLEKYSRWIAFIVVAVILGVTNPNESKHEYIARKVLSDSTKQDVGDLGFLNELKNVFIDASSMGLKSVNYSNYLICSTSTITVLGSPVGRTFGIATMVWVFN